MKITFKKIFNSYRIVAFYILIAVVCVAFFWFKFIRVDNDMEYAESPRQRPSAVYTPSATPKQRAVRPEITFNNKRAHNITTNVESEISFEVDDDNEDVETIEEDFPIPIIPDDDPAILAMLPEVDFSSAVWNALKFSDEALFEESMILLESEHPSDRAFGGVLLFATESLDGDFFDAIIDDPDPSVPIAVYGWVRDFGSPEELEWFSDGINSREFSSDELLSFVNKSSSMPSGGRAALDLWLSSFEDGKIPTEQLSEIVASEGASYDVRSQALFKLLEPETKKMGLSAIDNFASSLNEDSGVLLPQTIEKWKELSQISNSDGDEEKIWDSESAVVLYLSEGGKGLEARDLANYLEYALRRDDPDCEPNIELGTWEFANEFLEKTLPKRDSLSAVEIDALDRIAISLDRLVEYDPAFNPFEEVGDGEEIPEEFFEEDDEDTSDDEDMSEDEEYLEDEDTSDDEDMSEDEEDLEDEDASDDEDISEDEEDLEDEDASDDEDISEDEEDLDDEDTSDDEDISEDEEDLEEEDNI